MRIIGGEWGGRNITAPANLPARPTTDYAKSGLFNILNNHFDFEGLKVLDLFSGTGNIAYEFISRGCISVTCVDQHAACIRFIRETADRFGMKGIQTVRSDVFKYLGTANGPFDLVFADPPFDMENTSSIPDLVFSRKMLRPGGWMILEHRHNFHPVTGAVAFDTRKYGECAFSFYRSPDQEG